MDKEFYTPQEVLEMGILPYKSRKSIQRLIEAGKIRAVRGMTDNRSRVFIPQEEVERLRGVFTLKKPNKSMKGQLETK